MSIAHPSESIWIPGVGELRFDELQTARAVEEYDSELTLGQDNASGQWAVFLPREDGTLFPVLGLGHELPSPDQVKIHLHRHDVRRNGRAILAEMEEHGRRADAAFEAKVDEATEAVAEAIISNMNAQGTNPFPSVKIGGKYKPGHVRSSG